MTCVISDEYAATVLKLNVLWLLCYLCMLHHCIVILLQKRMFGFDEAAGG